LLLWGGWGEGKKAPLSRCVRKKQRFGARRRKPGEERLSTHHPSSSYPLEITTKGGGEKKLGNESWPKKRGRAVSIQPGRAKQKEKKSWTKPGGEKKESALKTSRMSTKGKGKGQSEKPN